MHNTISVATPLLHRPVSSGRYTMRTEWTARGLVGSLRVLGASDDGPHGARRRHLVAALLPHLARMLPGPTGRFGATDRDDALAAVSGDIEASIARIEVAMHRPTTDLEPTAARVRDARRAPLRAFPRLTDWQLARALSALEAAASLARLLTAPTGELTEGGEFARFVAGALNVELADVERNVCESVRAALDPMLGQFEPTEFDPEPGQ